MSFPLGDWIDQHSYCRHNLGQSGLVDTIRPPLPSPREVRAASEDALGAELGRLLGVDPHRVFLSHGATEGNALVLLYLSRQARRTTGRTPVCRVRYPEYPPLFQGARAVGFRTVSADGAADVAVVSNPRNPEGNLWSGTEVQAFGTGARALLVDETFREFTDRPSLAGMDHDRLWVTGSFTKVYGADDLRVGFVVAPDRARADFAPLHRLVLDQVAPYSIAGALRILAERHRLLREARGLLRRNARALRRRRPDARSPEAPVWFDRLGRLDGTTLTRRCLRASVLVCPGALFGWRNGVRIGLTRRSFPRDLDAYLAVRSRTLGRPGPRDSQEAPRRRSRFDRPAGGSP